MEEEEGLRGDPFTDCTALQVSGLGSEEFHSMNAEFIDAAQTENERQFLFIHEDVCQDTSYRTDISGTLCENSYFETATSRTGALGSCSDEENRPR